MKNALQHYFPMIRTRAEVLKEIQNRPKLTLVFGNWKPEQQQMFLDYVTGVKGVKILYDSFFKEIMNPETTPERLEKFLSLIFRQTVKIQRILPTDNSRIAEESSLLIMDILIEMEDGSLANLEVQKIGYKFPADYLHWIRPKSNTGIKLDLLQEYILIPLDIFRLNLQNRGIQNELDAWLTFLSVDEPERIAELLQHYPRFIPMYQQIYEICRNIERVMELYSEELKILDRNTVQLMIDEMQEEIDAQKDILDLRDTQISQQEQQLSQQKQQIYALKQELEKLKKRSACS